MIDRAARSHLLTPLAPASGERGAEAAMSDTPSRWSSLREILRYVPRFRDRVFVIALDGAVVEDDNFRNTAIYTAARTCETSSLATWRRNH